MSIRTKVNQSQDSRCGTVSQRRRLLYYSSGTHLEVIQWSDGGMVVLACIYVASNASRTRLRVLFVVTMSVPGSYRARRLSHLVGSMITEHEASTRVLPIQNKGLPKAHVDNTLTSDPPKQLRAKQILRYTSTHKERRFGRFLNGQMELPGCYDKGHQECRVSVQW